MYKINTIEELNQHFIDNNTNNSNDLGNFGLEYWNNKLKPKINPSLFKIPKTTEELKELINNGYPLLLIDTFKITDLNLLFENEDLNTLLEEDNNLKSSKYWDNPINYLGFWNTSNITDISDCFYNQKYFNQKIFWNTKKVEDSSYLFYQCENLNQPIELSLPKCKNISYMFYNCNNLNSKIVLENLINVENAENLFYGCSSFNQPIDLDLPNCQDISCMFEYCSNLNSKIVLNNLDNVVSSCLLFSACQNFNQKTELSLPSCKDISHMFSNCYNLNSKIILDNLGKVENYSWLFGRDKKLEFDKIESIIDQLVTKVKDIKELSEKINYKIPEEYKNRLNNKSFFIVNQI